MTENFAVFVLVAVYIALAITVRCFRARIRRQQRTWGDPRYWKQLSARYSEAYAQQSQVLDALRKPNTKDLYS